MNWALELLGLPADADVASVKRAYARLLRTTRPDEDAEAFQRLHTAYQQVLVQAREREAASPGRVGIPVHVADPTHTPPAAAAEREAATRHRAGAGATRTSAPMENLPTGNPDELASRVIQQATDSSDERALARWLSAQPELWSIRLKQQTGQLMLQQLFRTPAPIPPGFLDTLLEFFDLHQVQSGVNPLALAQLSQRQQAMWYLLPQNHRACARRLGIPTGQSPDDRVVAACLRLLGKPRRWYRLAWPAIRRGRVTTIARLIHGLCGGRLNQLPAQIDQRQADFWYRAAQLTVPSWPRFMIGSVRALFLGLMLVSCITSLCALASALNHTDVAWSAALGTGAAIAAGSISIWLLYAAWTWLDHWQGLPEPIATSHPWLRRTLIPLLCMLGIATNYLLQSPLSAVLIVIPTLVLAWRRLAHRLPPRPARRRSINRGVSVTGAGFLALILSKAAAEALPPAFLDRIPLTAILASAAMCLWFADMWRQRAHWKARLAS